MDIEKQIKYWINSAEEDILTAGLLIEKERKQHGLFFCHLAVEKILKALYVQTRRDFAPKTHNLLYLSDLCGLDLDDEIKNFFAILMKYQISGRYPDSMNQKIDSSTAQDYFKKTEEAISWLIRKLNQL